MKTGSNPIFFIRQTDVSRELLIPSSIVRFLVRFFRVVDGGRAKSEIKQQKEGGRERKREREEGNQWRSEIQPCLAGNSRAPLGSWILLDRETLWKKLWKIHHEMEKGRERERERERERKSLTRLPSILLDQSSFPCLRLIYRGAIDLLDPPPSFTWISREEIVSRSIYSIYSRDKRTRGERWWIMRRNPAEGGKLECFN